MLRLILVILLFAPAASAQKYEATIQQYRAHYKQEFLTDTHSPLKAADTGYLRFYQPDKQYCITATFTPTPNSKPFDIATHSGKKKPYRRYGILTFSLQGAQHSLEVYQGLDLIKQPALKDYLFIPFTDLTNYETTYAGGRYLDLRIGDIKDGTVVLDFNKCYNPYCAFAEGYACPIPPDANKLKVRIAAGEKLFGKQTD